MRKKDHTQNLQNEIPFDVQEEKHDTTPLDLYIEGYPRINYIGNKEKIAAWIMSKIPEDAHTLLDAFAGGSSIGYLAKKRGLQVYSNDILGINYHIARALIENNTEILTPEDLDIIFQGEPFEGFITKNYANVHYFKDECMQLDLYRQNILKLSTPAKQSLAYTLMRRAMIRKMPYSRFTIKWEKVVELRNEEFSYAKYGRRRAYHNKSFQAHFLENLKEYNDAVFDNHQHNKAFRKDIFDLVDEIKADVIYLDPPYAGTMNDYFGFYGFIDAFIEGKKPTPFNNNFLAKDDTLVLFDQLFASLKNFKYWMLSYNSRSYPGADILVQLMVKYAQTVQIYGMPYAYKVTGTEKKNNDIEYLFVVKNPLY